MGCSAFRQAASSRSWEWPSYDSLSLFYAASRPVRHHDRSLMTNSGFPIPTAGAAMDSASFTLTHSSRVLVGHGYAAAFWPCVSIQATSPMWCEHHASILAAKRPPWLSRDNAGHACSFPPEILARQPRMSGIFMDSGSGVRIFRAGTESRSLSRDGQRNRRLQEQHRIRTSRSVPPGLSSSPFPRQRPRGGDGDKMVGFRDRMNLSISQNLWLPLSNYSLC